MKIDLPTEKELDEMSRATLNLPYTELSYSSSRLAIAQMVMTGKQTAALDYWGHWITQGRGTRT